MTEKTLLTPLKSHVYEIARTLAITLFAKSIIRGRKPRNIIDTNERKKVL